MKNILNGVKKWINVNQKNPVVLTRAADMLVYEWWLLMLNIQSIFPILSCPPTYPSCILEGYGMDTNITWLNWGIFRVIFLI